MLPRLPERSGKIRTTRQQEDHERDSDQVTETIHADFCIVEQVGIREKCCFCMHTLKYAPPPSFNFHRHHHPHRYRPPKSVIFIILNPSFRYISCMNSLCNDSLCFLITF